MPNVRSGDQRPQSGYHTRDQINEIQKPAKARDNLSEAFAGNENEGPNKDPQATRMHSTNVKSRKTEHSRTKTPKR